MIKTQNGMDRLKLRLTLFDKNKSLVFLKTDEWVSFINCQINAADYIENTLNKKIRITHLKSAIWLWLAVVTILLVKYG